MSNTPRHRFAAMIDGVLLDLSGVLYVGDMPLPGAPEALQRLQRSDLALRYVTNTTRAPRARIALQLSRMGFDLDVEQIFTAPMAARDYLRAHALRPHLLIHPALAEEFTDFPVGEANAVLVGDAGEAFDYPGMNRAFRLLMDGAPLIAMGHNRYFREADGLSLDAGPFIVALEYAAQVEAVVTGKPAAEFFCAACAAMATEPARTVMIGDDVESDVNGATRAGLRGTLVRSGKYRSEDERQLENVDSLVLPDLTAAVDWLLRGGR